MHKVKSISLVAVLMSGVAYAADVDTIFGLQLHKPFTVPECAFRNASYSPPTNGPCFEFAGDEDSRGRGKIRAYDNVGITWPADQRPQMLTPGQYAIARIMDGKLESIGINTLGIESQQRDLQNLVAKYGQPTKTSRPIERNGYNDQTSALRAEWDFGDIIVTFASAVVTPRSGMIRVDTPIAIAERKQPWRCPGVSASEVRSLNDLPNDLRKMLPGSETGFDGIADRDGPFNATDVVRPNVPTRRFNLAAVGAGCAVVAVERGGMAHHFELTEYRLMAGEWTEVRRWELLQAPRGISDLLSN
jgi:hypothetical protein